MRARESLTATFRTIVRKVSPMRARESLGGKLYGITSVIDVRSGAGSYN